jgi:hypothetical protein
MTALDNAPVACSQCFSDRGLQFDAERIGREVPGACPNCGEDGFKKLPLAGLEALAHRFFVWGSLWRTRYGAAPLIQFNEHQKTSIDIAPWLASDVQLFERVLGVGFFHYGPRLWMVGEVEPLKALQSKKGRQVIIDRILAEYPTRTLQASEFFYRIRVNPSAADDPGQFDSPPPPLAGRGRLDSPGHPVLYGSPDLEVCVHECRVTAEDEVFVATLTPTTSLRLLDLSVLLKEEDVTEFESLDMSVHMLFLAGKHSYKITRAIADAARDAGFDGLVYPSYFSLLRLGQMPFQTVYGISHRRIPQLQEDEQAKSIPNLALFGRPVAEGKVAATCINKLVLSRVVYDFHFGPTGA